MRINDIDHIFDVARQLIDYISVSQPETESIMIDGKSVMIDDIKHSIYAGNLMSVHMIQDEAENMDYIPREDAFDEVIDTVSRDDILRGLGYEANFMELGDDEKDWLINMLDKHTKIGKWDFAERIYDKIK